MRFIYLVAAATLGAICSDPARAHYDPAVPEAGSIGFEHSPRVRNANTSTPVRQYAQSSNKDDCVAEFLRKAKQRAMREVAPEYNRRVRREGQAEADRWLARTAREIGIRDGKAAKKACGQ